MPVVHFEFDGSSGCKRVLLTGDHAENHRSVAISLKCSLSSCHFQESALLLLGNSGDIVFFFFDHLAFLARIGFLNKEVAGEPKIGFPNISDVVV